MPYTGTVPYPLHAALTCANTSEDSSKGRDMGLWIDYMDIVIRIVWIYYVLILSVDDDAPFALSPSILMLFVSFSYQTKSVQICCLFECSKFTCSIISSHLDL